MSKKTPDEKDILRGLIGALSGLSKVTVEMLESQVSYIHELSEWGPKYDTASKKPDFWRVAAKGLEPEDVASIFLLLAKFSEIGEKMQKFATLPPPEQEKVVKEYRTLSRSLNALSDKLSGKTA